MGTCSRGLLLFVFVTSLYSFASASNCSGDGEGFSTKNCKDGVVIPLWRPFEDLSLGDRIGRAVIYFIGIIYMFIGISIASDRFMSSIEIITSKEREITVKRPDGEKFTVTVQVWNETVSNLTLMALGSSAPEIMLSVIEVCGHHFEAGDLGPNTIVGSAAFNLFMIMSICVYVVPDNEVRRQKHLMVFFITAAWSIFAYTWLYLILSVFSYGVIEIWEGAVTFLFFPLTVFMAYMADRKMHQRFLPKKYRKVKGTLLMTSEGPDVEMSAIDGIDSQGHKLIPSEDQDPAVRAFEEHRRQFIELMKEIRRKNPDIDPEQLQQQAEYEMINKGPKSRAFYRVQATRKLTGGGNMIKKKLEKEHYKSMEKIAEEEATKKANTCNIGFDPAHYTVLENVGSFNVIVTRDGGPPGLTVMVDYYSEDGSANAGSDYLEVKGTLTFHPEDKHHFIPITVIDDDVFEEDEHFYVHLHNLRVRTKDGITLDPMALGGVPIAHLETPATATVMILDDDHAGVFGFESPEFEVIESAGTIHVKMQRSSGARGKVLIPYKCHDGTAISGKHYAGKEGEIVFDNDDVEKFIDLGVMDEEEYEKNVAFTITLGEPIWAKKLSDQSKVIDRYLRRQARKREEDSSIAGKESLFGKWFKKGDKGEAKAETKSTASEEEEHDATQEDMIADLGKPRLGENSKVTIRIRESKEFQNVVDRVLATANTSLVLGTSSWREQFVEALTVSAGAFDEPNLSGDEDEGEDEEGEDEGEKGEVEEEEEEKHPSWLDYIMHFICVPWKLLCALIPPTDYLGGWACFVTSILLVGALTALVGDLASHFGCAIGMKDIVTAITFVALGTSVPDTFASKVAAVQDKYADASIGNVTGSNGVNVFLGIGIAWTMAAVYHWSHGRQFEVEPGTLAFSVTIFSVEAFACIFILVIRRNKFIGGELGGPRNWKIATSIFMAMLWVIYIMVSSLEAYCLIEGF